MRKAAIVFGAVFLVGAVSAYAIYARTGQCGGSLGAVEQSFSDYGPAPGFELGYATRDEAIAAEMQSFPGTEGLAATIDSQQEHGPAKVTLSNGRIGGGFIVYELPTGRFIANDRFVCHRLNGDPVIPGLSLN